MYLSGRFFIISSFVVLKKIKTLHGVLKETGAEIFLTNNEKKEIKKIYI